MISTRSLSQIRRKTFITRFGIGLLALVLCTAIAAADVGEPEKEDLKFGFIKLTDMAPLAIAYEKGFFEDEGLYVQLEAQANWKVLLDGVIDHFFFRSGPIPLQDFARIGIGEDRFDA